MAKKRKKRIARKQRKQRKRNLTGMDFDALMALRNEVDEALTGYRSTLERQLEALGSSVASLGGKIVRGGRACVRFRAWWTMHHKLVSQDDGSPRCASRYAFRDPSPYASAFLRLQVCQ
jgi:hypothetical protein